jgi:hypothetical protein
MGVSLMSVSLISVSLMDVPLIDVALMSASLMGVALMDVHLMGVALRRATFSFFGIWFWAFLSLYPTVHITKHPVTAMAAQQPQLPVPNAANMQAAINRMAAQANNIAQDV